MIKHYYEFSIPRPPQMCCSPPTVGQGLGRGEDKIFSVLFSQATTKKNCWGCTQKVSFRESEAAWRGVRQVDQRLHELCSCKMNMEWSLPSMVLQCFHRFTSGAQEYSLLAGILVLSLKILILRIRVYIGLLILYCNIRWAAETSRGWGIYF